MKYLLLTIALLFAGAGFAGTSFEDGDKTDVCQGSTCDGGSAVPASAAYSAAASASASLSTSASSSYSGAVSESTQGQDQAQGQSQSVTVNAAGGGGKRPVSTAYAPSVQPTAPCYVPVNAGASGVGFSASLGTAVHDKECTALETIRIGQASENQYVRDLAAELLARKLEGYLDDEPDEEPAITFNPNVVSNVDRVTGLPSY